MKTAISIPDDLFREIDICARRLRVSRSHVFATAAREYLRRHGPSGADATESWNWVADHLTAEDRKASEAFQRHSTAVIRGTTSRRA
jgi:metal-responsive CopG/Arc/MetJ family transcriptional regulator